MGSKREPLSAVEQQGKVPERYAALTLGCVSAEILQETSEILIFADIDKCRSVVIIGT